MRLSLFTKIFLIIFCTVSLIFLVFIYQFSSLQKESINESLELKAKSIAQSVIISNSDSMILDDEISLLESVQDFVQLNDSIKTFVVTRKNGNKIVIKKDSWELLEESSLENEDFVEVNEINFYNGEEAFIYKYPVYFSQILWGDFKIELGLKEYNKQVKQLFVNTATLIFILILTSFLISYFIAKMISNPVIALCSTVEEISKGDLSKRAEVETQDEIGKLASSFNSMVSTLEYSQKVLTQSHEELEQRVEQRTKELNELNETLEKRVNSEISKRQEQEQLLIQQSKLASMGEMIGNIAHQWRQPLNAVGLVIQNIQLAHEFDELDSEFMKKSVDKVKLLTNNMSKTIDDFRNFFKPNKSKEIFVLNKFVENSLVLVESSFEHNNIKIEKNMDEQIEVFGYSNELSQTLLNILNNAKDVFIEKLRSDSKVNISIYKDESYGIVTIEDNAGGIPLDIMDKIFEPYFTTKEEGKGTGIGLYMSKIIIEQNMKGSLTVENTQEGAKFIVKIPLYGNKEEVLERLR